MSGFSCTSSTSSTDSGDIFQVRLSWECPSGCIIPKPLGPDPVACIFLHLPKLICLPCLTCLRLSPARSSPPTGPPHRHDAGAWVRPCHVNKSEWSSSISRHAPRTSPHQALSAFTSSGQTSGRQAAITANHVSSCACPQGPHGKDSRRRRESPFSRAIRLRVKRGAPEHRDSGALTSSLALTPWP